ncbi:hypothetical protein LCGC14_1944720 [marine sediment metagenome]|uniref:Macro domain-containing protein n=1 Tax=marine sediment metagenome TaxID=412755 RepID=A0A0F9G7N4_9ZZZZ
MIDYIEKSVIDVETGIVAHGVNCQGKMGSGVAKAIRAKWPIVYEEYKKQSTEVPGSCLIVTINDSLHVANCYTQKFYGYDGNKYADPNAIGRSMEVVGIFADMYNLPVFMPKIGCGLGGLDWNEDVLPIMEYVAEVYNGVTFYVCDLPRKKDVK